MSDNTPDDPRSVSPEAADTDRSTGDGDPRETVRTVRDADVDPAAVATELSTAFEEDSGATEPIVDELQLLLTAETEVVRIRASEVTAYLAKSHGERLTGLVNPLGAALEDSTIAPTAHLRGLVLIAVAAPSTVTPLLDDAVAWLHADDVAAQFMTISLLEAVGDDTSAALAPHVSSLVELLETVDAEAADGHVDAAPQSLPNTMVADRTREQRTMLQLRQRAAGLLVDVARADPDAVLTERERLASLLEQASTIGVRQFLLDVACVLTESAPEITQQFLSLLSEILRDGATPEMQAKAAQALAFLAAEDVSRVAASVAPAVSVFEPLLDHDDPSVVGPVTGLLAFVCETDSPTFAEVVPELREVTLNDALPSHVRANAAWALGYLGTPAARGALQEAEEQATDADVRTVAAEAKAL